MILKPSTLCSTFLALLVVSSGLFNGRLQAAEKPQPTIVVEANYPGASATVIADTVAAPIEEQVQGVLNALQLVSRSSDDGKYILAVTFKPGDDLEIAKQLVQNRVSLALPVLPEMVQKEGVTVRKKLPVRMIVSLTSPEGRYDGVYLSNYATANVADELARVPGVAAAVPFGLHHAIRRVILDPKKMADLKLTANEVAEAIAQQNLDVSGKKRGELPTPGPEFHLTIKGLGRVTDPKEFADVILKTDGNGTIVRLKDVARVEEGTDPADRPVSLNGKPAVVFGVYPTGGTSPDELGRVVEEKLSKLRARLPKGLNLETAFDFTANLKSENPSAPDYLLLDLQMPGSVPAEGILETLTRCEKLVGDVAGVRDVLALTENPFDMLRNQPCILVRLAPADQRKTDRQEIVRAVRTRLEKVPDLQLSIRDLSRRGSFPHFSYPIDFAVSGPEAGKARELVKKLSGQLQKSKKLTDVWSNQVGEPRPHLYIDIDREKARALGVAMSDISNTLEVYLGSTGIKKVNSFGRTRQVVVQADDKVRKGVEDLKLFQIRNAEGQMVPLGSLAVFKNADAPTAVCRLNLQPMVEITANLDSDVTLRQARTLCESLFEASLPAEYKLTWLQNTP